MKNDVLSDALHHGDPAEEQPEAQTMEERKAALLARCAAEPLSEPARVPSAAQTTRLRKTRWALPALAGAGALTATALYGAAAWFGVNNPASPTVPARMVQVSPRPSATPAPRETGAQAGKKPGLPAPLSSTHPSGSVAARTAEQKRPQTRMHRDTQAADSVATVRAVKRAILATPSGEASAFLPISVKTIVRTNHRKAEATKSQAAPALSKIVEPVVERVIIEQDATPAEATPTITTVAITINGRAESVIVSRAAEPATN